MANVNKDGKRGKNLPRVTNGHISTGSRVEWLPPDESGMCMCKARGLFHTLDVWQGFGADRVEYQIQLTDEEMLRATSEWLATYYRKLKQNAKS